MATDEGDGIDRGDCCGVDWRILGMDRHSEGRDEREGDCGDHFHFLFLSEFGLTYEKTLTIVSNIMSTTISNKIHSSRTCEHLDSCRRVAAAD